MLSSVEEVSANKLPTPNRLPHSLHEILSQADLNEADYLQMLSEQVARRQQLLNYEDLEGSDEEVSWHPEEEENPQVTVNLESILLLENKLHRMMTCIKTIRNREKEDRTLLDTFEASYNEIVEMCEDYWYIVRMEASLFCRLPEQMFGSKDPDLVMPVTRSFVLTMILVSVLGFLISNQDFTFQLSHLQPLSELAHNSFLIFMRIILSNFSQDMFQTNFWARSMQQIVHRK